MAASDKVLSFRIADPLFDRPYVLSCGEKAWLAVYGNLRRYNPDFFRNNSADIQRCREDNIWIALCGGKKAGLYILDSRVETEERSGHISLLFLEEEFRGQGLGTQLIAHAEAQCISRGLPQMRLFVASVNQRARRFYAKCGYTKYGTQFPPFSGQIVLRKPL